MAGEATSAILTATDLEVKYNEQIVLNKASLSIGERERIGMVGRNGTGKSTFLKILAGEQHPDAGEVVRRRDLVTGYLSQDFTLDPAKNVYENIRAGAQHVLDSIHEFESLPVHSKKHDYLDERIQRLDGWNLDNRIETAMAHLNTPDGERGIGTLSGGEKRRVALCRAIVSQPDLLILDEPTNHLDTESIEWVGDFLQSFSGSFLLVTHDRYFLDRITNVIVELANGTFFSYTGNYTDYLVSKAEREASSELVEHKRQMFLRRELEWVRKSPKARTTKSQSRLDRYYEVEGKQAFEVEKDIELIIPPPPQLGNRIVDLDNVGMELGGRWLFHDVKHTFEAGMRIGVCGRNGLGKTTLLKIIMGDITPTEGTVKIGQLTKFNYVDQGRLKLREEKTVFEEISDGTEFVVFGEGRLSLRAYLKRFLFADDRINTQVKYLSGGERSRLLLARVLKNGGNFLILDEPTNDLDLPTLRILEEALIAFPGCVLVVSHDRYFLNRVCTGIMAFEGDERVAYSVGGYDYYLEKKAAALAAAKEPVKKQPVQKVAAPVEQKKAEPSKARKLSWKEVKELEGMEAVILAEEAEIARIEALFLEPDFHRQYGPQTEALTVKIAETKAKVARLYDRWHELEALKN